MSPARLPVSCLQAKGQGLSFRLQEGQQVIVLGSVSVYERNGQYQLYAREIMLGRRRCALREV